MPPGFQVKRSAAVRNLRRLRRCYAVLREEMTRITRERFPQIIAGLEDRGVIEIQIAGLADAARGSCRRKGFGPSKHHETQSERQRASRNQSDARGVDPSHESSDFVAILIFCPDQHNTGSTQINTHCLLLACIERTLNMSGRSPGAPF